MSECWSENPEDRPTFQWICASVKRLISDQKVRGMICRYTVHNTQINQDRKPFSSVEYNIAWT